MEQLYTVESVKALIEDLTTNHGYTLAQLTAPKRGSGDCVLIAPDGDHYNFVIQEIALSHGSGQRVRKCRTISKSLQAQINRAAREGLP